MAISGHLNWSDAIGVRVVVRGLGRLPLLGVPQQLHHLRQGRDYVLFRPSLDLLDRQVQNLCQVRVIAQAQLCAHRALTHAAVDQGSHLHLRTSRWHGSAQRGGSTSGAAEHVGSKHMSRHTSGGLNCQNVPGRDRALALGQPDAREAERIRAAKEAELTHGVRVLAYLPKVRDYLEWYLDWYEAEHPTTISKARSEVKRFLERFGHRPIDSIRAVQVEQYKRFRLLDDKAAKETVGKEIRRLKAAFNRGIEWKELDVNPLASVKGPRGVRSVAVKFYDRAAMCRLYRENPGRAPLWLFTAHTGLRRGEIIGMEKSSVVAGRLLVESDPDESGEGRTK